MIEHGINLLHRIYFYGSEATSGIMAQALKDAGAAVGNAENTTTAFQAAAEKAHSAAWADKEQQEVGTLDRLDANFKDKIGALGNYFAGRDRYRTDALAQLEAGQKQREKNMETGSNMIQAAEGGDFAELGKLGSSNKVELSTGGISGNYNVGFGGGIQGGAQSGVSFSHNASQNYSFGMNVCSWDAGFRDPSTGMGDMSLSARISAARTMACSRWSKSLSSCSGMVIQTKASRATS